MAKPAESFQLVSIKITPLRAFKNGYWSSSVRNKNIRFFGWVL